MSPSMWVFTQMSCPGMGDGSSETLQEQVMVSQSWRKFRHEQSPWSTAGKSTVSRNGGILALLWASLLSVWMCSWNDKFIIYQERFSEATSVKKQTAAEVVQQILQIFLKHYGKNDVINNMKSTSSERGSRCNSCLAVCRCTHTHTQRLCVGIGMVDQLWLAQIFFVHRLSERNRRLGCSVLGDPRFRLAVWNSHWMSFITPKRSHQRRFLDTGTCEDTMSISRRKQKCLSL